MTDRSMGTTDPRLAAATRRAAGRLAEELNPSLPAMTERMLAEGTDAEPRRSFDPMTGLAVAGFLLAVAQLGWKVYRDVKEDREKAAEQAEDPDRHRIRSVMARRIRLELEAPAGMSEAHRDRVVDVVVEEILVEWQEPDRS
jgi:hypothetical protein